MAEELQTLGIVPLEVAVKLRLMARYRNRWVHFYDEIAPRELYGVLTGDLQDVRDALALLQHWLDSHPEL